MKKRTGAIVFYTIGVLYFAFWLIERICNHARPALIVLIAVMLLLFAVQLYLACKGERKQDNTDV